MESNCNLRLCHGIRELPCTHKNNILYILLACAAIGCSSTQFFLRMRIRCILDLPRPVNICALTMVDKERLMCGLLLACICCLLAGGGGGGGGGWSVSLAAATAANGGRAKGEAPSSPHANPSRVPPWMPPLAIAMATALLGRTRPRFTWCPTRTTTWAGSRPWTSTTMEVDLLVMITGI